MQEWNFGDQEEESIVTIKLHLKKQRTFFELLQTNIPDEAYDRMIKGWNQNYFGMFAEFYF